LIPLHRQYQRLGHRIGQTLEIAIYRALCAQTQLTFLGSLRGLDGPDDALYSKDEPPSTISGNSMEGELDFIAMTPQAILIGLEAKNIREWLYPQREEISQLLQKCTAVDAVPVLVPRRIHFSTFRVLNPCGVVLHQTYNQLLPMSADWTDEQIMRAITEGISADGRRLAPPMSGRASIWARLTERDQRDLVAYLSSLPPQE
jgi:hypothetical protein